MNDWQGPQMVKYKNKLHPWKYIVVLPVARNPIKISSPNLAQLKPVHEGIRRVLLAQQRSRGGGGGSGRERESYSAGQREPDRPAESGDGDAARPSSNDQYLGGRSSGNDYRGGENYGHGGGDSHGDGRGTTENNYGHSPYPPQAAYSQPQQPSYRY